MTIEEATFLLSSEDDRSEECLAYLSRYNDLPMSELWEAMEQACRMAVAALRAQREPDHANGFWQGEGDGYADGAMVYDVWHCSCCDYTIDDGTDDPKLLPNYCPDCGAKMDGDVV